MKRTEILSQDIYSFWGNNTFLKIKNTAFGIGQVLFSFVTFENVNGEKKAVPEKSVDCYLDIYDALSLTTKIIFGKIEKLKNAEKEKGEQYPKAVWESGLGGINEENTKRRNLREDGMAISRKFEIAPSTRFDYVFAAKQGAGQTNEQGLIVPKGKPEIQVFVPVASEKDMQNFAEALKCAIQAYKTACYIHSYNFNVSDKDKTEKPEVSSKPETTNPENENKVNNNETVHKDNNEPERNNVSSEVAVSDKNNSSNSTLIIVLTPYTPAQPTNSNNGDMCMQALNKDNEVLIVIFKKKNIDKVEPKKWQDFEKLTQSKGKKFSIAYTLVEKGGKTYYYFNNFA